MTSFRAHRIRGHRRVPLVICEFVELLACCSFSLARCETTAMKPGRNDPCPCGSGRKYKHCCLGQQPEAPESKEDVVWRQVNRAVSNYSPAMVQFIKEVYGDGAVDEAWDEFMHWDDDVPAFDPRTPHMHLFTSWFFHVWTPDVPETAITDNALHDRPPASVYLERGRRIDPVLRRYLESCLQSPPSFFEILRAEAGRALDAKDVFTGEELHVLERAASQALRAGELIFAQIVPIDGIVIMEACSRCSFKPVHKIELMALREGMFKAKAYELRAERRAKARGASRLERSVSGPLPDAAAAKHDKRRTGNNRRSASNQLTGEDLCDWDPELRNIYLMLFDQAVNPPVPELTNTDGEKLVMHEYSFEVESAQAAFDALKHLAGGQREEDLVADAKRSKDGALRSVQFAWTRKPDPAKSPLHENPALGFIDIDGRTLKAQLNSVKRAAVFRRTVEKFLGPRAKLLSTEVTDVREAMLESRQQREAETTSRALADESGNPAAGSNQELLASPEMRQKFRELMTRHYEQWLHDEIPALGGRTPLQAVRSKEGREKVAALVAQIEHDAAKSNPPLDPSITAMLRQRLKL